MVRSPGVGYTADSADHVLKRNEMIQNQHKKKKNQAVIPKRDSRAWPWSRAKIIRWRQSPWEGQIAGRRLIRETPQSHSYS
ncbi:hypothetical protein ACN38_g2862 [Penicillium nordicum]|uniref:Uncharacterized protein n=1 Tax=Penicillium nordicum TaxID=229535 RepID=A0A0M8P637_9EURO|nr:hypothetical protein ACN38_g2862 [Penicillium nordicum]